MASVAPCAFKSLITLPIKVVGGTSLATKRASCKLRYLRTLVLAGRSLAIKLSRSRTDSNA